MTNDVVVAPVRSVWCRAAQQTSACTDSQRGHWYAGTPGWSGRALPPLKASYTSTVTSPGSMVSVTPVIGGGDLALRRSAKCIWKLMFETVKGWALTGLATRRAGLPDVTPRISWG